MLVRAPLVKTQQHGSIRVVDLTPVVMTRRRFGLPKEGLVPFEAAWNVSDADDRPYAFHCVSGVALTDFEQRHEQIKQGDLQEQPCVWFTVFPRNLT